MRHPVLLLLPLVLWLGACGSPREGTNELVLIYLEGSIWLGAQDGVTGCAYESLGIDREAGQQYLWAYCGEFSPEGEELGGTTHPVTLSYKDGIPVSHWAPDPDVDPADLGDDVFPPEAQDAIGDEKAQAKRIERLQRAAAERAEARAPLSERR